MSVALAELDVGAELPALQIPPISRTTLALFAGASGDHNPIHIDSDFAKAAGLPDVFAHGMLSMAYLGRLVTGWVPQERIRGLRARFKAITNVGDELTCSGQVTEIFEAGGERRARIEITTASAGGDVTIAGEAVVALD